MITSDASNKTGTITIMLAVFVTTLATWFVKPIPPVPPVAQGKVYESAASWCLLRIYELPKTENEDRRFFTLSLENIRKRNVRWSIDDPDGIYYQVMVDFAKAWEDCPPQRRLGPK